RLQSADSLLSSRLGTEQALAEGARPPVAITGPGVSARTLGALISLFERAVGIYAELIDVNAYDQPGVEAGKKAAKGALEVLHQLEWALTDEWETRSTLASRLEADERVAWRLLQHLGSTGRAQIRIESSPSMDLFKRANS